MEMEGPRVPSLSERREEERKNRKETARIMQLIANLEQEAETNEEKAESLIKQAEKHEDQAEDCRREILKLKEHLQERGR